MGARVTIAVPVYGVERYIERCARSLFEQTWQEIEYLFVDDCSLLHRLCLLPHRPLPLPTDIQMDMTVQGRKGVRTFAPCWV